MPYIHNIDTKLGYFIGWHDPDTRRGPGFDNNPDLAVIYDLSLHKREALDDYEALVDQGHEPSLDTVWVGERR